MDSMEGGIYRNVLSNGKGPTSSGSGSGSALYVEDNDMDADFLDYGERMGERGADRGMLSSMSVDDMFFERGTSGGFGGSGFYGFGHSRGGHFRGQHKEQVDKVVHADFFNKFDDLLDMDDLV